MATIAAGPASHFLVAFCLLIAYFGVAGEPVGLQAQVGRVLVDSPAYQAGIRPGDRIVQVGSTRIRLFEEVAGALSGSAGKPVQVVISRNGVQRTVSVTPRVIKDADNIDRPRLGVATTGAYVTQTYSLGASVPKAFGQLGHFTQLTVDGLRGMVKPERLRNLMHQVKTANTATGPVTYQEAENRPTSVIGMVTQGGQAAGRSMSELLLILVAINLGLGVFNLIPMLPLDGGHMMLATWEAIVGKVKGRRHYADMTKVMPFAAAFLAILLVLGVSAMYLDIVRPV